MNEEKYIPWDAAEVLADADEEGIIEYLIDALEENDPEFFARAVSNVARAKGMTAIAQEARPGHPNLYKTLSRERDPRIGTVMKALSALGIRLTIAPKQV